MPDQTGRVTLWRCDYHGPIDNRWIRMVEDTETGDLIPVCNLCRGERTELKPPRDFIPADQSGGEVTVRLTEREALQLLGPTGLLAYGDQEEILEDRAAQRSARDKLRAALQSTEVERMWVCEEVDVEGNTWDTDPCPVEVVPASTLATVEAERDEQAEKQKAAFREAGLILGEAHDSERGWVERAVNAEAERDDWERKAKEIVGSDWADRERTEARAQTAERQLAEAREALRLLKESPKLLPSWAHHIVRVALQSTEGERANG